MILVNTKRIFVQCLYTDIVYWVHKTLVFKPINFNKFNKFLSYSNLHLQKHYPLAESLVINCRPTPCNCHGVCIETGSSRVVYVWHQTKKSLCLGPLPCLVASCRVVSCRTCVN